MSAHRDEHVPAPPGEPRHPRAWLTGAALLVLVIAAGLGAHEVVQRRDERVHDASELTGGDPARAPALMRAYGCAGCHAIPGVRGADGLVGPPLAGFASRVYIGGVLLNDPNNLVTWLMNPKAADPKTAMPAVGLTQEQARHIAAYLYTLR